MPRSLFAVLLLSAPLLAQSVNLAEQVKPGEHFGYALDLKLSGTMTLVRNGKTQSLPIGGSAGLKFVERVESPDVAGAAGKVVRHYSEAKAAHTFGGESSKRELSAERRLTVAMRAEGDTVHICPTGLFTRDELDIVGDHFDTLALPLLLPGKDVKVGDTWAVSDTAAQHALSFDGLSKNALTGKLAGVKDGVATFTVTGSAEGVELAAGVKVKVQATGTFDVKSARVTGLTWEQADEREAGPVNPATEVKATWTVARTALADEPKELNKEARAKVPTDKIPAEMTKLRHDAGKYAAEYARQWMTVGNTADHLVLRLVDAGEPVAQATLSVWRKADAGKHATAEEFKQLIEKVPGWEPTEVLASEEVLATAGKWVYCWSGKGKQDGAVVVQTFYLVAGPSGEQVTVGFLSTPDKAKKLAEREKELVAGITFPDAKK